MEELALKYALNNVYANGSPEDQLKQHQSLIEVSKEIDDRMEDVYDYINVFGVHLCELYMEFSVREYLEFVESSRNTFIRFAEEVVSQLNK